MTEKAHKICTRSVLDDTIPGIRFDANGEANYCLIFDNMAKAYPRGTKGEADWKLLTDKIKQKAKGRKYDCIVGISGGTDSCYLLHLACEQGLKPLAVYIDNGWSTDTSLKNIRTMTQILGVDLETYVLDYDEISDLLRSYMKAGLPWIDFPTDFAIQAALFRVARKERIPYMLIGYDFRSEGKQPTEWTYGDYRQLKYLHRKFGRVKLKSYPVFTFFHLLYWSMIKGIKMLRPYYYLPYSKQSARELLIKKYGWIDYGGHHHENAFTKYAIATWLPQKFNIDKRKITLSAQVLSSQISREDALEALSKPPCTAEESEAGKNYVIKKLGLTEEEYLEIWNGPNRSFRNYPSYYPMINMALRFFIPIFKWIFPWRPALFYEMEIRNQKNNET